MEKRLLDSREAIELLVNSFYTKVQEDALLGPIFMNAENFQWDTHIPIMVDFWETLLLGIVSYKGNAMAKHLELHRRTPLGAAHFEQWKKLFYGTLDDLFEGPGVILAKKRVEATSGLMQYKINESEKKGFIQ
ncbi:MAG: group III truncated hemoglobin [Chitinophagaceae bacterium]|nr:group III truncated hemoglobin [Chitinophagaceae bacterium]